MILCIFCIGLATIIPLPWNMSNANIECPGDIIPYTCSIRSNSETIHLTWLVMIPGFVPINITYDHSSEINREHMLNDFITAVLTEHMENEYVKSTLSLALQENISLNQTKLQCSIEGLGYDTVNVFLNSSSGTQSIKPT